MRGDKIMSNKLYAKIKDLGVVLAALSTLLVLVNILYAGGCAIIGLARYVVYK